MKERIDAILADLGGDASIVKAELITRFAQASAIADHLGQSIAAAGVLTSKGRTRAAVLTYLKVVDRLLNLAKSIGLERRPKDVETVADILAEYAARDAREKVAATSQAGASGTIVEPGD